MLELAHWRSNAVGPREKGYSGKDRLFPETLWRPAPSPPNSEMGAHPKQGNPRKTAQIPWENFPDEIHSITSKSALAESPCDYHWVRRSNQGWEVSKPDFISVLSCKRVEQFCVPGTVNSNWGLRGTEACPYSGGAHSPWERQTTDLA